MKANEVYVVTFNVPYEGSDVEGIFSTYEKAVAYIKKEEPAAAENKKGEWTMPDGNYFSIDAIKVDEPVEQ